MNYKLIELIEDTKVSCGDDKGKQFTSLLNYVRLTTIHVNLIFLMSYFFKSKVFIIFELECMFVKKNPTCTDAYTPYACVHYRQSTDTYSYAIQ